MSQPADHSEGEELSLDRLSQAYAQAMGRERRPRTGDSERATRDPATGAADESAPADDPTVAVEEDDAPVSPLSILEAILFVGQPDNSSLSAEQAAAVMRGVEADEIPAIVDRLNQKYAEQQDAFEISQEADGYRLRLREEFARLRDAFHGRTKETTLSQAAVDVLALVAYKQPISLEEINKLRGINSGGTVRQLVRRRLIRFEPDPDDQRVKRYFTTRRMLNLLGLESMDDLPQSDDA